MEADAEVSAGSTTLGAGEDSSAGTELEDGSALGTAAAGTEEDSGIMELDAGVSFCSTGPGACEGSAAGGAPDDELGSAAAEVDETPAPGSCESSAAGVGSLDELLDVGVPSPPPGAPFSALGLVGAGSAGSCGAVCVGDASSGAADDCEEMLLLLAALD